MDGGVELDGPGAAALEEPETVGGVLGAGEVGEGDDEAGAAGAEVGQSAGDVGGIEGGGLTTLGRRVGEVVQVERGRLDEVQ